jgi:hypothetical protein
MSNQCPLDISENPYQGNSHRIRRENETDMAPDAKTVPRPNQDEDPRSPPISPTESSLHFQDNIKIGPVRNVYQGYLIIKILKIERRENPMGTH